MEFSHYHKNSINNLLFRRSYGVYTTEEIYTQIFFYANENVGITQKNR